MALNAYALPALGRRMERLDALSDRIERALALASVRDDRERCRILIARSAAVSRAWLDSWDEACR